MNGWRTVNFRPQGQMVTRLHAIEPKVWLCAQEMQFEFTSKGTRVLDD